MLHEYVCDQDACDAPDHIGYCTCSLYDRFGMHTQNGSIKRHLIKVHAHRDIYRFPINFEPNGIKMVKTF